MAKHEVHLQEDYDPVSMLSSFGILNKLPCWPNVVNQVLTQRLSRHLGPAGCKAEPNGEARSANHGQATAAGSGRTPDSSAIERGCQAATPRCEAPLSRGKHVCAAVTAQQSCQAAGAYHGSAAIGLFAGRSAFYSECIHAMAPHAGSLEVFLDQLTYSFGQHIGPA